MATGRYLREQIRKEDPYIFDNAQNQERRRVDEQSRAVNILMQDESISAPISKPSWILELGYGTGLMCNLLARKCPEARVYGVDPSPTAVGFHEKHTTLNTSEESTKIFSKSVIHGYD
jgi:methylase of polypeptide subunit release factors